MNSTKKKTFSNSIFVLSKRLPPGQEEVHETTRPFRRLFFSGNLKPFESTLSCRFSPPFELSLYIFLKFPRFIDVKTRYQSWQNFNFSFLYYFIYVRSRWENAGVRRGPSRLCFSLETFYLAKIVRKARKKNITVFCELILLTLRE